MNKVVTKQRRKRYRKPPRSTLSLIALLFFLSLFLRLTEGAEGWIAQAQASALGSTNATSEESTEKDNEEKDISTKAIKKALDLLRERERKIEEIEKQLEVRLATLRETETRVTNKIKELKEADQMLRARMAQSNSAAEEDLVQLTSVYAQMKPKNAALLFEQMDPKFAAGFLARMKPDSAAAILAGLSPELAYTISVVLAGRNANALTEDG